MKTDLIKLFRPTRKKAIISFIIFLVFPTPIPVNYEYSNIRYMPIPNIFLTLPLIITNSILTIIFGAGPSSEDLNKMIVYPPFIISIVLSYPLACLFVGIWDKVKTRKGDKR